MRRAKNKLAFIFAGMMIVACIAGYIILRTRTVSYADFLRAAEPNLQNTLISVSYYCGSKDGFDHFLVIPPLGVEERYRVSQADSKVVERFSYTKDRSKWRDLRRAPRMLGLL